MKKLQKLKSFFLFIPLIIPKILFAADGAWAESATTMMDDVKAGLMSFASIFLGCVIIVTGLVMAFYGKLDAAKLWSLIIAGVIIGAGGTAMDLLIGNAIK